MKSTDTTSLRRLQHMGEALDLLKQQLGELGLNLTVWDHLGRLASDFKPCSEFCRVLHEAGCDCQNRAGEFAAQVMADGKPAWRVEQPGACLLCVPVLRRRRLVGAAVACFPSRTLMDFDRLARLCDRHQLDRQYITKLAQSACRHDEREAEDLLKVMEWLLDRDQVAQVAKDELTTLSTNLASTYEELSLLYRISGAMRVTQRMEQFLAEVCDDLLEVMSIDAVAAVVCPPPKSAAEDHVAVAGALDMDASQIRQFVKTQIAPRFAVNNRAILENVFVPVGEPHFAERIRNFIAVPLVGEDNRIGVLMGLNKSSGEFDSVDLKLISSIGSQASIFLSNRRLYADLQDLLLGVLHALTATIDAKDPYTCGHSQRVAMISKRLAEAVGFPPDKAERIYLGGLLHDIGKIGVPESILRKDGRLTDREFTSMRQHPETAARILDGIRQLNDVIVSVRCHHEHPDGTGYPQGLQGDEISLEGLILGLADSFDAMTSDRTYRKALPLEAVVKEIRRCTGTQFHPDLVNEFLSWDLQSYLDELRTSTRGILSGSGNQEDV